jgi:hypothetical protein
MGVLPVPEGGSTPTSTPFKRNETAGGRRVEIGIGLIRRSMHGVAHGCAFASDCSVKVTISDSPAGKDG